MVKKKEKSSKQKKLKAVDPFYNGERKLLIDKGLIRANQAPKTEDESKMPMKLREYLELNEKLMNTKKKLIENHKKISSKKEKKSLNQILNKKADERGSEVPLRPVNKFKKSKSETEEQFLNRIEKHSQNVINRSKYETQFDVRLEANEDKVIVTKNNKMSEKKRRRLNKLKEKLKIKKLEKQNKLLVKSKVESKFGDVVEQPPTITSLPRLPKNLILRKNNLTIPIAKPGKNGITEEDRNIVIQRYRIMKNQGKFN